MLIGQEFHTFSPDERRARLGGFTDTPPNLAPATSQDFYRLLSLGGWIHERRQIRLDGKLQNSQLFIRPDLSGVLITLAHRHARPGSDDPIWGSYDAMPYTFAACRHMTITRSSSVVQSGERVECAECGFWTRVTSD